MKARRISIETLPVVSMGRGMAPRLEQLGLTEPAPRRAGRQLDGVADLLACLQSEGVLGEVQA